MSAENHMMFTSQLIDRVLDRDSDSASFSSRRTDLRAANPGRQYFETNEAPEKL